MKPGLKVLLIVLGIVALFILLVVLNRSRTDAGISCETKPAAYGSILSKVSGTGELRATAQVNLQAQVMGVVRRLRVEEGQQVNRGDTLLELDRQTYEAQLTLARAQFNQTRLRHNRMESLYARGLISSEEYEASKTADEVAEAQFRQAQDQYNKTVITAPISGRITRLNIKEGETVVIGTMNAPGTVLMVIADLSAMQALIQVDETDIVSVKPGQEATVRVDALPDTSFTGRVTRVGYMPVTSLLTTDQTAVNFEVEISLDSTIPQLRPGMTVHADIITARLDSVLVIPLSAVGRRKVKGKETETVFVVRKGRAVLTPVRTGSSSDTEVEITEGLNPGDQVIVGPYKVLSRLSDGTAVRTTPAAGD
ncbi:MAG: efflux RND transporter periplasmic adaptor subunit [candidate division WOR-3 bacterium]|jgi:HlyD family secretion protein